MSEPNSTPVASRPHRRWFYPAPSWLVLGLIAVTGLLFASERWKLFWFNQHKGWTVLIAVAAVGVAIVLLSLWFLAALVFRRRFQFSIRTLLVLVVAVALPCSWLAVEMKRAREQRAFVAGVKKSRGIVNYDRKVENGYSIPFRGAVPEPWPGPGSPPEPTWLRNLLGDDFLAEVVLVSYGEVFFLDSNDQKWHATDTELAQLEGLVQLQSLSLNGSQITDAGLTHIAGLTRLTYLFLNDTQVTDAGLAHLAGLTQLRYLHLSGQQVTDTGLAHIAGLTQLQYLNLEGQQVTDAGLAHIARLTQLEGLWLDGTQVTDAGLKHVAGLRLLQELSLDKTQVTDAGLTHLTGLLQLETLNLRITMVTDAGVKKLQQALPNCEMTK